MIAEKSCEELRPATRFYLCCGQLTVTFCSENLLEVLVVINALKLCLYILEVYKVMHFERFPYRCVCNSLFRYVLDHSEPSKVWKSGIPNFSCASILSNTVKLLF